MGACYKKVKRLCGSNLIYDVVKVVKDAEELVRDDSSIKEIPSKSSTKTEVVKDAEELVRDDSSIKEIPSKIFDQNGSDEKNI